MNIQKIQNDGKCLGVLASEAKSYQTRERAIKAFNMWVDKNYDSSPAFTIVVMNALDAPSRFIPVVIASEKTMHYALDIASNGFPVISG